MLGSMTERAVISLGVAAAIGPEVAGALAPAVEAAGFHALWVNDTPGADSLAVLAAAARVTQRLTLATGIIPVDRRPARGVGVDVDTGELPQDRLVLGIGAGRATHGALQLVRDAASALRLVTSARIVIGALGPRMRRLAVEESDGVLLSWLTPEVVRRQAAEARAVAPGTHVAVYVRTALDPDAQSRLQAETARYAAVPAYAANFERTRMRPEDTVMDAAAHPIADRLEQYRNGPGEVILRVVTARDTLEDYLRFIDAARELL